MLPLTAAQRQFLLHDAGKCTDVVAGKKFGAASISADVRAGGNHEGAGDSLWGRDLLRDPQPHLTSSSQRSQPTREARSWQWPVTKAGMPTYPRSFLHGHHTCHGCPWVVGHPRGDGGSILSCYASVSAVFCWPGYDT
ncbi:hypothetical protein ABBQ38_008655 [Trebouxia sp. C0009 RCD-2024]